MARRRHRFVTVLVAVLAAVSAAVLARNQLLGDGTSGGASTTPTAPSARQAMAQLDRLTVAAPLSMAGYSREKFPHWIDQGGGCDTREVVLKRQGTGVHENSHCHPTSGHWISRYDDATVTDPNKLDIDHLVPLADAWRSGAKNWTTAKREKFANDLRDPQLIAVSASTNRSKGDQDPSQWKPPNRGYWCEYARDWIQVKSAWHLTVTSREKDALVDMLGRCTT